MAVEVVDYDPRWADLFTEQRDHLSRTLKTWLAGPIEHVGSTSVPGLRAKPIIDILAPVASLTERDKIVSVLVDDGWLYWPEDPAGPRLWFLRPNSEHRTHHLHVIERDHPRARMLRTFRDALRGDARLAHEYAELKTQLAKAYPTDRRAYRRGKTAFVSRVLADR